MVFISKVRYFLLVILICTCLCDCVSSQSLPFNVLQNHVSLESELLSDTAPGIIIFASPDDIVSPGEGINYPPVVSDLLSQLNYEKSFAILFQVGQRNVDTVVKSISKKGNKVVIEIDNYSIGHGNYEIPGFTMPYQLITVEKVGKWGNNIHFEVRTGQSDIVYEIEHYIP